MIDKPTLDAVFAMLFGVWLNGRERSLLINAGLVEQPKSEGVPLTIEGKPYWTWSAKGRDLVDCITRWPFRIIRCGWVFVDDCALPEITQGAGRDAG